MIRLLHFLACLNFASFGLLSSAAADWPRFLGEQFDGVAKDARVSDPSTAPKLDWSIDVGEGYGLGAIQGGQYFHFDAVEGDNADGSNLQERLRCIDLASGEVQWSVMQPIEYRDLFGYENGPRSTPTVGGESIYTLGVSGQLCCRHRKDGKLRWSVDTSKTYGVIQNFFGVGSSPLVVDDSVIVMVGGSPNEDQDIPPMQLDRVSDNGSALVAFGLDQGEPLWKCGEDLASYGSPRTIKVGEETFVLAFCRSGVLLVDPGDGTVVDTFDHRASKLESVNAMMPIVDGQDIFVSECYEVGSALLRLQDRRFNVVWQDPPRDRRRQSMRCHWATPVLIDGFLYGCSGRNAPDSDFRCIEFSTGKVRWTDDRRTRTSVTRVGDRLAVLEERGTFQWVQPNPEELSVIGEFDFTEVYGERASLRYPCWAAPIVSDGKMLIRGDKQVLCLEL